MYASISGNRARKAAASISSTKRAGRASSRFSVRSWWIAEEYHAPKTAPSLANRRPDSTTRSGDSPVTMRRSSGDVQRSRYAKNGINASAWRLGGASAWRCGPASRPRDGARARPACPAGRRRYLSARGARQFRRSSSSARTVMMSTTIGSRPGSRAASRAGPSARPSTGRAATRRAAPAGRSRRRSGCGGCRAGNPAFTNRQRR